MSEIYLKEECFKIIGLSMEVHKILGIGHSEVVYKDALEYEFQLNNIPYKREFEYKIAYKDIFLPS
jgi:GxxExxY protein